MIGNGDQETWFLWHLIEFSPKGFQEPRAIFNLDFYKEVELLMNGTALNSSQRGGRIES